MELRRLLRSLAVKLINGITSGIGISVGIVLVIGIVLVVRAVAPGTVTNPTFGPSDDDVTFTIGVDSASCYWTDWSCQPVCAANEVVTGIEPLPWNESCGGFGNDFDTAAERVQCCKLKLQ